MAGYKKNRRLGSLVEISAQRESTRKILAILRLPVEEIRDPSNRAAESSTFGKTVVL